MRREIDRFTADKGKLPKSIDELVEQKYLREKPRDPVNEEKDEWKEIQGDDSLSPDGEQGLDRRKKYGGRPRQRRQGYSEY
jgi:general secretion pathway protein G